MVHVRYSWTPELLGEALRLHAKRSAKARFLRLGIVVLIDGAAAFLLVVWAVNFYGGSRKAADGIVVVVLLFLFYAVCVHLWPTYVRERSWKSMFPAHITHRDMEVTLSPERISYSLAGVTNADLSWSVICQVLADDRITMLYMTRKTFIILPKSAISPEDFEKIRELIAEKVSAQKC